MASGNGHEAFQLTTIRLRHDHDVVLARQRARVIAGLIGFDAQDQVKFATAVSEIARNACRYAQGGEVKFSVRSTNGDHEMPDDAQRSAEAADSRKSWWLVVRVADKGNGIPNLESVLDGTYVSSTGMGLGIIGAKRLSDWFKLDSQAGKGTSIDFARRLPHTRRTFTGKDAVSIAEHLASVPPTNPLEELERQNQEILGAMEEIREKQLAVERLNSELAETNRGVLALYAELDDRAAELKRISEYKSRFLSDISHELRTPLTSVQNVSRILLDRSDGDLTAEQQRQVTMIRKAAEGLTEMVNELLDLARIEAGRTTVQAGAFNVGDLFSALRGLIRPVVGESVTLVIDEAAAEAIPQMHTDERRLSQILRNFLSNAVKFTEQGTVTLSASAEPNDMIRFTVTDTGIGIASEDMPRIFEDFTQVDHPIQRRVRGSGLGLPLTKKLAALLGGCVYAESTPGAGSKFTVVIPRVYRETETTDATVNR
jgi:signal transduction histidine kinase